MRALWMTLLLAATVLAGCADETPPADDLNEIEVTADTGGIRGVVVDSAIRPLVGATVTVKGGGIDPQQVITDEDGAFTFSKLPPGTYFLVAEKVGYFQAQQSTDVVAGVADPKAVRILLEVDASYVPYFQAQVFNGYIECTTSLLVLCGLPNLLTGDEITNDRYTPTLYFDAGADLIQSEMVWTSSQSVSPELYFEMEALDAGCPSDSTFIDNTRGPSPIYTAVNASTLEHFGIGGPDCGIYYSVFSGAAAETPPVPGVVGALPIGATAAQDFQLFVHEFHEYLPPEGWRFSSDGEPPGPPE